MPTASDTSDLLVFSHLRWDFLYQRPHHLLSRHARHRRVFYFEEPILGMTETPRIHLKETFEGVLVIVPYLPANIEKNKIEMALKELVDELIYEEEIIDFNLWFYNPQAYSFSKHLNSKAIIVDYMDAFSHHKEESNLLEKADLVFTSGHSLSELKKNFHSNVHAFPSSLDYQHFSQARQKLVEPDDQINLTRPRIGFYGIIDNKFNFDLLHEVASIRPEYQFVIVGPVVGVDKQLLPHRHNIHFLGIKDYHALPLYLAGWDCTILPLKTDETTRYTCPFKVLEFLAAAKPVVSSSVQDIVNYFEKSKLIHFADEAKHFADAIDMSLAEKGNLSWMTSVDQLLRRHSWDQTYEQMLELEMNVLNNKLFSESSRPIRSDLPTAGVM